MDNYQMAKDRIGILDPLRFLAAILVMLYHYQPYLEQGVAGEHVDFLKYGYLGVNFFFMLSGFVIMASAENRSAIKFALLRALRLYPAFIGCLLLTLAAIYTFDGEQLPALDIVLNALIINDYFGINNIDGVYWTLQAELKFYGCVFLLILTTLITSYRIWVTAWLVMAVAFHFSNQPFFLGWFISPGYSFHFMGGVTAYHLFKNPKDRYALILFVVALVFSSIKSWEQIDGFCRQVTNVDRLLAATISAVFFVFYFFLRQLNSGIKYSKTMVLLGGMSYPLYLLHNRAGKEILQAINTITSIDVAFVLTLGVVLTAAFLIHVLIEKPIFRAARKHLN